MSIILNGWNSVSLKIYYFVTFKIIAERNSYEKSANIYVHHAPNSVWFCFKLKCRRGIENTQLNESNLFCERFICTQDIK